MNINLGGWWRLRMILFLFSVPLQLVSGTTDDRSSSEDGKTTDHSEPDSTTGLDVLYACLGGVVGVLLAIFLFKLWRRKKREEQHARLLRLFEDDDELELELGLRD